MTRARLTTDGVVVEIRPDGTEAPIEAGHIIDAMVVEPQRPR